MTTSGFSPFSSIFGFVVAAISLVAFAVNICRSHLPSNRIKVLESLLDETETCFRKAIEDGLLTEPPFVQRTERGLGILKTRVNGLRSRAYSATNLQQDYAEFFRGTSIAIGRVCQSLKKLRAQVITSSEEGRQRLTGINSTCGSTTFPSALSTRPEHRSNPQLCTEIPRPCSCPPAFPAWNLGHPAPTFNQSDPFHDPTLSDCGVRITDVQNMASTIHTSVTFQLHGG